MEGVSKFKKHLKIINKPNAVREKVKKNFREGLFI